MTTELQNDSERPQPLGLGSSEGLGAGAGSRCMCKDRELSACPGEWEPGCDLGANGEFCQPSDQRITSDEACRFAVWWAHKRKTFTTPRQAAWAAWSEAHSKAPNPELSGTAGVRSNDR